MDPVVRELLYLCFDNDGGYRNLLVKKLHGINTHTVSVKLWKSEMGGINADTRVFVPQAHQKFPLDETVYGISLDYFLELLMTLQWFQQKFNEKRCMMW